MIFNFNNMAFSDEDWKYIILQYLKEWTEIPLTTNDGYDIEELKFFDGFLGTLLKQTESLMKDPYADVDNDFVDSWKYQGKLYRVLHRITNVDNNGKEHSRLPRVRYHRMITHWTSDYTFSGLMYKLSPDEKYIILEADTGNHLAFDVNKFRKANNAEERYTQGEEEIIFPMYEECIKEYRMTINEFIEMKEQEEKE